VRVVVVCAVVCRCEGVCVMLLCVLLLCVLLCVLLSVCCCSVLLLCLLLCVAVVVVCPVVGVCVLCGHLKFHILNTYDPVAPCHPSSFLCAASLSLSLFPQRMHALILSQKFWSTTTTAVCKEGSSISTITKCTHEPYSVQQSQ